MSNENDNKKSDKAIVPAKQPLPPVQEVEETDLGELAGGCVVDSCTGTCGTKSNTGGGGKII